MGSVFKGTEQSLVLVLSRSLCRRCPVSVGADCSVAFDKVAARGGFLLPAAPLLRDSASPVAPTLLMFVGEEMLTGSGSSPLCMWLSDGTRLRNRLALSKTVWSVESV